jgi:prepilin peptidase CpaA
MASLNPDLIYLGAALAIAVIGAVTDYRSRRIPNWLTGPSILLGIILHLVVGGWRDMASAALAGLLCGGLFLIFFLAGGMGGGDVKLIAAVGCLAGLSQIAVILIATSLIGGLFAIILAVGSGQLWAMIANVGDLIAHHSQHGIHPHPDLNVKNEAGLRLPYGIAIAAGTAFSLSRLMTG